MVKDSKETLTHHFPVMASETNKEKLTNGVFKIQTWITRVNKLAKENTLAFPDTNKFKGDAFEHLVEAMIAWGRSDKSINCVDIKPSEYDAPGVDFIGLAHDMKSIHTIQAKMKTDTRYDITEGKDHIAMFPASSLLRYNATYMTLWTTANGLTRVLDEEWNSTEQRVVTIGIGKIKKRFNDNLAFWNFYSEDLLNRG